ncbi:hypothetical protein Tco_0708782, partial [Tanacetum coccineum]
MESPNNNQTQSHDHHNNNHHNHIEEEEGNNNNDRYVDLDIVYSTTTPCSSNNYSNAMSKKVTANKLPSQKPPLVFYYSRSRLRRGNYGSYDSFLLNLKNISLIQVVKTENVELDNQVLVKCSNKKRKRSQELVNLGLDESVSVDDVRKLRGSSRKTNNAGGEVSVNVGSRKKRKKNENVVVKENGDGGEAKDIIIDNGNESTAA